MSYLDWKVGDKVVCVDASDTQRYTLWIGTGEMDGLQELAVYTIRRIGEFRGVPVVWLEEIYRPIRGGDPSEPGYAIARFRPVQKRTTDISALRALLNPTPEQISDLAEHEIYEDARSLAEAIFP